MASAATTIAQRQQQQRRRRETGISEEVGPRDLFSTPLGDDDRSMVAPVVISHESRAISAAAKSLKGAQSALQRDAALLKMTNAAAANGSIAVGGANARLFSNNTNTQPSSHFQLASSQSTQVFEPTGGADDDEDDDDGGGDDGMPELPLLDIENCSFVSILGVALEGSAVAVAARESVFVYVRHASIRRCTWAFTSQESQKVVPFAGSDVSIGMPKWRQQLSAAILPHWLRFPGYLIALGLFTFFTIFCLFLTSALTTQHANEWIIQCAVSLVLVGILVQPAQLSAKSSAQYVLASAAAASAKLNQLLSFF